MGQCPIAGTDPAARLRKPVFVSVTLQKARRDRKEIVFLMSFVFSAATRSFPARMSGSPQPRAKTARRFLTRGGLLALGLLALTGAQTVRAADDDAAPKTFGEAEAKKAPSLHQLYKSSSLPRTYADFSMFHFVPRGAKIVEQPERGRLIFRDKVTGQPDGYAELKGDAVLYFDATGKPIRLQHLTAEEMQRWMKHSQSP